MIESTIDYRIEKFLITNEPVMELVVDVLQILNKIGKITIKEKVIYAQPQFLYLI